MAGLPKDRLLSLRQIKAHRRPPPKIVSGVYFLFRRGKLVYVGQSNHIDARLSGHNVAFDEYAFIECEASELDDIEAAYIFLFKPPMNTIHGGTAKSEGLKLFGFGSGLVGPSKPLMPRKWKLKRSVRATIPADY